MRFFDACIDSRAVELATEVLKSGWLGEGDRVKEFESRLTALLGLVNPVAVNSGTSALHLALVLAGVERNDEVILPAQTFVATGMAVLMQQAKPVFADIDPQTGNLSTGSIRDKISSRTKAIIPVHWGGYPCDLDEINAIASDHGVTVIEDAAHALGANYRENPIGAISPFTCFSFQAIKHVTTGDGGALCCRSIEDFDEARHRRWFGIDRENARESILGERVFEIDRAGFKYHMNDLAAAVGLGNLDGFSTQLARRQEIGAFYRQQLSDVPGLELLECSPDRTHAYWLFSVLVERREDVVRKLKEHGIPASVVHQRIDRYTVFGGRRPDLAGQDVFDRRHVALPLHGGLSAEDVQAVVRAVRGGW